MYAHEYAQNHEVAQSQSGVAGSSRERRTPPGVRARVPWEWSGEERGERRRGEERGGERGRGEERRGGPQIWIGYVSVRAGSGLGATVARPSRAPRKER